MFSVAHSAGVIRLSARDVVATHPVLIMIWRRNFRIQLHVAGCAIQVPIMNDIAEVDLLAFGKQGNNGRIGVDQGAVAIRAPVGEGYGVNKQAV